MNLPAKPESNISFINRLAIFLLPAIFLCACQGSGDNISSSTLQSNGDYEVVFTDTFTIECSTFLRDSVNTSFPVNYLVGEFSNETYGKVNCNSFFQVTLNNDDFAPGSGITFDSMVLVLTPNYIYGAENGQIRMGVHRLKEALSVDSFYYSFSKTDYEKEPLVEISFTSDELGGNSLRIPLNELGEEINEKLDDVEFSSVYFSDNDAFVTYLKGFALITQLSENSVIGWSSENSQNTSQTGLYFYYTFVLDEDTIHDEYRFGINENAQGYNQLVSERPSILNTLRNSGAILPSDMTANQVFIQAGSGILPEIKIPDILEFLSSADNLIVNRAEIYIPSIQNEIPFYDPPQTVFLFQSNENQDIIPFSEGAFGEIGVATTVGNDYLIDITQYFQYLIEGRVESEGYILLPTLNGSSVNQFIFNDQTSEAGSIQLLVYYIPVN